ncbi:MAG TPA: four helix bundle protein [Nitrospirae bacterium]|nr:four helix bundle protein [Nitrospirota bacterium]
MKDSRELNVWEKSHRLTLKLYKATSNFPREEVYGLTSQIRRAGASIPTNIAEGCGRSRDTELARFLEIAMGSASEVEYLLLLSNDLNLLHSSDYKNLMTDAIEIKRMLTSFFKKLKADC